MKIALGKKREVIHIVIVIEKASEKKESDWKS